MTDQPEIGPIKPNKQGGIPYCDAGCPQYGANDECLLTGDVQNLCMPSLRRLAIAFEELKAKYDAPKAFRADLDDLRAEDVASILIGCDNPDCHIEEGCHVERIRGKDLAEALRAARAAKEGESTNWRHFPDMYPKARRNYRCVLCGQIIAKGERYVSRIGVMDDDLAGVKMHFKCEARTREWDGLAWECYDSSEFLREMQAEAAKENTDA